MKNFERLISLSKKSGYRGRDPIDDPSTRQPVCTCRSQELDKCLQWLEKPGEGSCALESYPGILRNPRTWGGHCLGVSATVIGGPLMKNCFVRLEKLDKKVLDRYLRRKDSSVSFESIAKKKHRKRARDRAPSAKSPSKTAEESPRKESRKRKRKTRAKPSHRTQAEIGRGNFKENISVETAFDNLSPLLNERPKPEVAGNYNGAINGTKKMNGIDKKEFISNRFLKDSSNKTAEAIKQRQSDVRPSEAFLQNAIRNEPEKMNGVSNHVSNKDDFNLARVKQEVQSVEEFGSVKTELKWDEEDKHFDMAEFEDEDIEPRDDDEDDRATVVFERSFNDGTTAHFDEDVFDKSEEKSRSVTKKFQKKKMVNRKKKTLVKFKRKRSIIGRNLAKVRKLKKKKSEVSDTSGRKQPAERESDKESNVGEVCGLVKRLHELYRIILQLQKQLPMNAEQSEYFIRTIKAHQENFYKEIKKSEKTIMKGYDKMLSSFGNASTVSVEIGKRTSLSKEDIADVISKCNLESSAANLQEVGASQSLRMEKSTKEGLGNIFNHPGKNPAPCSGSGHGTADPVTTPRTPPASGHHRPPKSLQRPNNESNMAKRIETRENHSTEHFLYGPPNSSRVSRPLPNSNQPQWFEISKPRAHFGFRENFPQRTHVPHREPRFIRFPQQDLRPVNGNQIRPPLSRPMHGHLSNIRPQCGGAGMPIHGGGTPGVNYRPVINNFGEFVQVSDGFVPSAPSMAKPAPPRMRIQSLMDVNPFPFGYSQGRTPPQHFPQSQNLCSAPPAVQLATGPHFDRPKHGNAPAQTNGIRNDFSHPAKSSNNYQKPNSFRSKRNSECNVSGASTQTFPKDGQCVLRNLLATFSRFLQSNAPPKQACPVTETPSVESRPLDPTVPQKLTMRNCRLEAGPVLVSTTEGVTPQEGEKPRQGQGSTSDATETTDSLNQTELNSRVYVCAHNGCKNPGVRICKGCLSIIYCSETCQLKHWSLKHKMECHQLKELRG